MIHRRSLCVFAAWQFATLLCGAATVADEPPKKDEFISSIDQRIEAWQPTDEERRVDEIGWAEDIRAALKLGKEHERPIFVFTHDGRLGVGRQ